MKRLRLFESRKQCNGVVREGGRGKGEGGREKRDGGRVGGNWVPKQKIIDHRCDTWCVGRTSNGIVTSWPGHE